VLVTPPSEAYTSGALAVAMIAFDQERVDGLTPLRSNQQKENILSALANVHHHDGRLASDVIGMQAALQHLRLYRRPNSNLIVVLVSDALFTTESYDLV
jgi:hypothetical protein